MTPKISLILLLPVLLGLSSCYSHKNTGEYVIRQNIQETNVGGLNHIQYRKLLRSWDNWNRSHLEIIAFRQNGEKKLLIATDQINDPMLLNLISAPALFPVRNKYADVQYTVLDSTQCVNYLDHSYTKLEFGTKYSKAVADYTKNLAPAKYSAQYLNYFFSDSLHTSSLIRRELSYKGHRALAAKTAVWLNGHKHALSTERFNKAIQEFIKY
jgi:hypothetical protein